MRDYFEEFENRTFYQKLKDKIYFKWLRIYEFFYYDFIRGIKNLIKWFTIIWEDREYDYVFLYKVLIFKLENMYSSMSKFSIENDEDLKLRLSKLSLLIKLLKKISEEEYSMEYYDYYKSTFNLKESKLVIEEEGPYYLLESKIYFDDLESYFKKHKARVREALKNNPELVELRKQDSEGRYKLAVAVSKLQHQKALKIAFELLGEKIDGFWY